MSVVVSGPLSAPANVTVKFHLRPECADLGPPEYASDLAAGADLRAALETPMTLAPGARAVVPTGLTLEIPPGFEAQVRARSGLALKKGLALANGVGTMARAPGSIVIGASRAARRSAPAARSLAYSGGPRSSQSGRSRNRTVTIPDTFVGSPVGSLAATVTPRARPRGRRL